MSNTNAKPGSKGEATHERHRRSKRRGGFPLAAALLALASLAPGCFGATSLLSAEARRDLELQPGVVLIVVSFEASLGQFSCKAAASGTGFLYRPDGYLITNGHVAQWARLNDSRAATARMKMAAPCLAKEVLKAATAKAGRQLTEAEGDDVLGQVAQAIQNGRVRMGEPSILVVLDNDRSYRGEIKAYSDPINEEGKDIAVIKVDDKNLPTVALGTSENVNVGDPITVIGYPGAANVSERSVLVPTVTNGRISAVNKQDYKGTPVLQSEAPIAHGNSGGPAFDEAGRVIGVATYTMKEGSQLNFFVPIDTALEFVRTAGAAPMRGPFDQLWHNALDAYGSQKWSKAHDLMGSALEMMPGQPDAKRLQMQAAQNIPSNPVLRLVDQVGMGMTMGILGASLAIIGAIVFFTVVKGKGESPPKAIAVAANSPSAVVTMAEPVRQGPAGKESFGSLQISNGPLAGNRFVIPKAGLMIGRDPSSCAVVLPDETVSKQHVWVVPIEDGVAVIDKKSANGTYVNSTNSPRINKVLLKDGDRIFVGRESPTEIMYFRS